MRNLLIQIHKSRFLFDCKNPAKILNVNTDAWTFKELSNLIVVKPDESRTLYDIYGLADTNDTLHIK